MKRKTSITLSGDVVAAVAKATRPGESRSEVIERLLRQTLAAEARRAANARDLAIINRHAQKLNEEAEDVLSYQVDL